MSEQAKKPVAYILSDSSRCYSCDRKLSVGEIVRFEKQDNDREVKCKGCAGLDTLAELPSGNARLTRLAKKYAKTCYILLKWDETWKSYQRVGLLIDKAALDRAREEAASPQANGR